MIGIVGQGFVGNAVYQKFKNYFEVLTYDIEEEKGNSTFFDIANCKIVFICVPTPMNRDGSCNTDSVEWVVKELSDYVQLWSKAGASPTFIIENQDRYLSNFNWLSNWYFKYFIIFL
mgnify:CR=1 FL=1